MSKVCNASITEYSSHGLEKMCGRLNTYARSLAKAGSLLDVQNPQAQLFKRFIRASDQVSIIREYQQQRYITNACWWLLLEKSEAGFKPSKYTSFNTRFDKLNTKGSAGYQAYREARCIIPVKGFGETYFVNKKPVHYYDFTAPEGEFICLGGLYKTWYNGEHTITSCSVITLPPHPKLTSFHSKASPLIVPSNRLEQWLDSSEKDVSKFNDLLIPYLPCDLIAQEIDKPSTYNAIGEASTVFHD